MSLHAVFITATEFPQAGLEFPLLFVATGHRDAAGRQVMSTVALLGLAEGENLQLEGVRFEPEAERTRTFCERVVAPDVLKQMKAGATLPDGQTISVDGFHAIDEDRLHALPDATVLELYRMGMLALMQVHLLSLANIRRLVDRLGVVRSRRALPTHPA